MKTLTPYKNIKATVVAIDSRYRLYYSQNRTVTELAKQVATTSGAPPIHKDIHNSIVGYKNANHYKLALGTTFNNIFTVRLLSTEIPNVNHLIDSNGCCSEEDKSNNVSNCKYPDVPNNIFPSRMISNGRMISKKLTAFNFYGPTCDSLDYMKGPFLLPNNIKENDYIELGQLGAYGITFRTKFNGFFSDNIYEVEDKAIMSIYTKDTDSNYLVA